VASTVVIFCEVERVHDGGEATNQQNGRAHSAAETVRGTSPVSFLLDLQRRAGNQATSRFVRTLAVQRHEGPTLNQEVEGTDTLTTTTEDSETTTADAQPGTGTTGSSTGGLTGAARAKAIQDTMRASDTGTWALGIVDKWKIPVDYEYTGQGSFHQGGKIYINKTLGIGAAALTMMHEGQHADTYMSGKQADRSKLSREEYIKQSIADEAEAVVRQIEGLAVTEGLGVDMSGNPITDGLKQRYLKAFYKKRDELKAGNPTMTTAEINNICRTSTRDGEVTSWFSDGTFVTSTDKNSYSVFYGKQWDDVHKAPGK
jgi:hypothetical protein